MRDTRQRMVSIRLHAYLMLITPISDLSPRRRLQTTILRCAESGFSWGGWALGPERGVGECPVLTTGASAQHHRSPNHCLTTPPMCSPYGTQLSDTFGPRPNTSVPLELINRGYDKLIVAQIIDRTLPLTKYSIAVIPPGRKQ